jgi:hypothetical protein
MSSGVVLERPARYWKMGIDIVIWSRGTGIPENVSVFSVVECFVCESGS